MDLQSNPSSRYDDLLDAVDIIEHPLIIHGIGAGITKKHTVQPVHEVIIAETYEDKFYINWSQLLLVTSTAMSKKMKLHNHDTHGIIH